MTTREEEILKIIKIDPTISQEKIAKSLNIKRASVAVHISNLMKKGVIVGKGYICSKEEPYICVIGGSNVDITGFPKDSLIKKDSNPGIVKISLGGVGRNISENIARLGVKTKLLTAIGGDDNGQKILDHAKYIGLNMENSLVVKNENTSTYLCVMGKKRDMNIAISSMDILKNIDVNYIKRNDYIIKNSKFCVVDANLYEILEYLVKNYEIPFILDTVSVNKGVKIQKLICYFHTIKTNKIEAEALSGISINSESSLKKVGKFFIDKGVKNIFITLGSDGVYYKTMEEEGKISSSTRKVINATGAGDAFVAGLSYGMFNNSNIVDSIKFSIAMSILTISSEETINPDTDRETVLDTVKKLKFKNKKI